MTELWSSDDGLAVEFVMAPPATTASVLWRITAAGEVEIPDGSRFARDDCCADEPEPCGYHRGVADVLDAIAAPYRRDR